jgi:hypothetical protein
VFVRKSVIFCTTNIIHHHLSAVETGFGKVLNSIILILHSRKDVGIEGARM